MGLGNEMMVNIASCFNLILTRITCYIYIQGIYQTLLFRAIYNKYISQKKEKQEYIAVSTVRIIIEPSDKH